MDSNRSSQKRHQYKSSQIKIVSSNTFNPSPGQHEAVDISLVDNDCVVGGEVCGEGDDEGGDAV